MEKQKFTIPNISCGHCAGAITDELLELTFAISGLFSKHNRLHIQ